VEQGLDGHGKAADRGFFSYSREDKLLRDKGDKQAAIADFDQAIKLKPDYADAYYNRGNSRQVLGEKQRAIADFQKAAELYRKQGKTDDYQDALNRIKKLQ
jgi:tetratricopeptide (TPR) repeat protein